MKEKNVPVILTGMFSLPSREDDAYDTLYEQPAKLQQAGVRFCISTGDAGAEVRNLAQYAGMAAAFGLSKADAVKAVTLYPAQIMNVADRLGSIEAGKDGESGRHRRRFARNSHPHTIFVHRWPSGGVNQ